MAFSYSLITVQCFNETCDSIVILSDLDLNTAHYKSSHHEDVQNVTIGLDCICEELLSKTDWILYNYDIDTESITGSPITKQEWYDIGNKYEQNDVRWFCTRCATNIKSS